jgi:membrane associated rhomboid family serine protease
MNDLKQLNETEDAAADREDWVLVGHYQSLAEAYEHCLVILAMGEACRVSPAETPGVFILEAEIHATTRIAGELDAYRRETGMTAPREPLADEWPRHSPGWLFCGCWVSLLMAVFYWQGEDSSLVDRAASSSVGLFGRGEWWRPFTGLFLHADIGHLVGNLVGGAVFGTLVARLIGPLRGWTLILTAGTLGNLVTSALTYPQPFNSIGASTAVFAALGILSGVGIAETLRERAHLPWLRILAPVFAGIILLGWLGGGSTPQTDVLGHVFGFGSGLAAGAAVGALDGRRPAPATNLV